MAEAQTCELKAKKSLLNLEAQTREVRAKKSLLNLGS
jgi:hypothetical protein